MTLLVNLFGSPGAGKSTARAEVFALLKRHGVNCEEVYEFAKKLTWTKRMAELSVQPYILGKQLRDIETLRGQVDVIITDSPLLLSYFYGKKYCGDAYPDSFYDAALDIFFRQDDGFNYFIRRVKPYNPAGRNQTEAESDEIANELAKNLFDLGVDFNPVDGNEKGSREIANDILLHLGRPCLPERLYDTRPEALQAPGTIYEHYKGGIYRLIDMDEEEGIVTYEHLWPHSHEIYKRDVDDFVDDVDTEYYTGPRFRLVE